MLFFGLLKVWNGDYFRWWRVQCLISRGLQLTYFKTYLNYLFFQIETGCVYVAEKKDSKTILVHAIVFIFIENHSLVWKRIFELRSWPRTGIIPQKTKKTNCCKLLTSYLTSLLDTLVYPPKNVFSNFDYDSGTCFITLLVKFAKNVLLFPTIVESCKSEEISYRKI